MYRQTSKKNVIFKSCYLAISCLVVIYIVYLLADYIAFGFREGLSFDDCVILISSVISALFEGSIAGFIVRSYRAPTILMKNLVFKQDGTPYKPGIALVSVGCALALAVAILFTVSGYGVSIIEIPARAQRFICSVGWMLFVNFLFTDLYCVTYRHESGTFAII